MDFRNIAARHLAIGGLVAGLQVLAYPAACWAQSNANDPTFGNRAEKADGSVALTVGRRLPTEWDTKFGMDAQLAPEPTNAGMADSVLQGGAANRSSGAIWGNLSGPGAALWDKTSVDARVNPAQEQGQVVATMSRTLPLGENVSVTLQDKYSVTQSLQANAAINQPTLTAIPPGASVWETDRSLRFNLAPTGTTVSAGVVTTSVDHQWHNKVSVEQQLVGPLSVTTSVTDPASATSSKSIGARFKHTW